MKKVDRIETVGIEEQYGDEGDEFLFFLPFIYLVWALEKPIAQNCHLSQIRKKPK